MFQAGSISKLPFDVKILVAIFLAILSIGFLSAIQFVHLTTEGNPKGIEENYLGNEEDLNAIELKFKKSEKQMLNIIHTHVLSMSIIFLVLGLLVATTPIKNFWRKFLLFEPLLSVLLTFGSIYLMWKGYTDMKYLVMVSGFLMTISFISSVIVVYYWLFSKKKSIAPGSSPLMK